MSGISLSTLSQNLNIATVEQLHVYTGMLLNRMNPSLRVLETQDGSVFAAEFNIFTIADGSQRVITRTSLEIDPTYSSDKTKKLWMFVNELTNTQVPSAFLSN